MSKKEEFEKEFKKEQKEHPGFTDEQVTQIVEDHQKLQAGGLDETENSFRYRIADPARFDKEHFRTSPLTDGVKVVYARVKNSERWEIQTYIFSKDRFKTAQQVKSWLEKHLKSEISSFLDLKAFNEYRRRCINAYMQNSTLK